MFLRFFCHICASFSFCVVFSGCGIIWPTDYAKIRSDATDGFANAQYTLGHCYQLGINRPSIEQDAAEAARWYMLAANQGHMEAQYRLGKMYLVGEGVSESEREAAKWLKKAGFLNHPCAQYYLGKMYENGVGVLKDEAEAARWIGKAAEQDIRSEHDLW